MGLPDDSLAEYIKLKVPHAAATGDTPPLREPTFFILSALSAGDSHGYRLLRSVEEMSQGRVRLRAGTLYGALERLESEGLIAKNGTSQGEGPVRVVYRLTDEGRARLRQDVARLEASIATAKASLRLANP